MEQQEQLLRVAIGGHLFALPMGRVSSLLRAESIQYSPAKTGPFGWSLSPTEVEIWQIHRALGLEPAADPATPAIQLQGEPAKALLVDSLEGSVMVEKEAHYAPLPFSHTTHRSPLLAIALYEETPLPVLDLDAITDSAPTPSSSPSSVATGERPAPQLAEPDVATSASPEPSEGREAPTEAASRALLVPVTQEAGLVLTLAQIRAVSAAVEPIPLPASPPYLRGVSSWENEIVYHVDWRHLLGLPQASAPRGPARTVIASDGFGHLIAFQSSSEMAVLEAEASLELVELETLPFPALAPVAAYFRGRLAFFPDLDAVTKIRSPSMAPRTLQVG
ncbi:MAG: chemotaxis protein CheW [Deltaproteobacteria bacterium]|nr:chemotaxis protein CheW [Deltaproteobacteria bacterium]